jgi:SAM-dependent methyltransferase
MWHHCTSAKACVASGMSDPRDALTKMLPMVEGRPDAMAALARQLHAAGKEALAVDLAERVLKLSPGDSEARTNALALLSEGVPNWHFPMVRDAIRNQAYEDALARAVFPGCKVLEIGTGSGLLAMMAARLGAEVVTCEMNAAIASAARENIAANGFADRVRVVNKHSETLDPAADMGWRADILVSEIVSNDLLSECVLPAHEHAVRHLLKPGGKVIPARGVVRVALAYLDGVVNEMGPASGFDLSAFDRLYAPFREVPVHSPHLQLMSEPRDLFAFDFGSGGPWREARSSLTLAATGGPVNGIAQWIALDMDDAGGRYENLPGTGVQSCWGALFWRFAGVVESEVGQAIAVEARHNRTSLRIWRG